MQLALRAFGGNNNETDLEWSSWQLDLAVRIYFKLFISFQVNSHPFLWAKAGKVLHQPGVGSAFLSGDGEGRGSSPTLFPEAYPSPAGGGVDAVAWVACVRGYFFLKAKVKGPTGLQLTPNLRRVVYVCTRTDQDYVRFTPWASAVFVT